MYKFATTPFILTVVLMAFFMAASACKNSPDVDLLAAPNVDLLAVPVKGSFASGEQVQITLTLKNTGTEALQVSEHLDGNFTVEFLRKNSKSAPSRIVPADYDEELGFILKQNLKTLQVGESISLLWQSTPDSVLGGQSLTAVTLKQGKDPEVTYYLVGPPGTYDLSVVYKYAGLRDDTQPPIYNKETNRVSLSFIVTP